jgi:hypothetical protein
MRKGTSGGFLGKDKWDMEHFIVSQRNCGFPLQYDIIPFDMESKNTG